MEIAQSLANATASIPDDLGRQWTFRFGGNFVSTWAYECRARDDSATRWFVSRLAINELPPGTRSVLVRVRDGWVPAIVDRSRQIAVEAMLLHEVVANEEFSGIDSEVSPDSEHGEAAAANLAPQSLVSDRIERPDVRPAWPGRPTASQKVTAAAISMAEMKFVVVLVDLTTASGPGEADLVVADMQSRFGVPVVLMGQEEDGTPVYYGSEDLKDRVAAVPVDQMPWKEYTLN